MLRKLSQLLLVLLLPAALGVGVFAAETVPSAYDVIERKTEQVMALVVTASDYEEEDPERYYTALQAELDDLVDFSGFARAVMGPYASRQRYQSLSAEGKEQLRQQAERFTEVMRVGLVRTYGKGLIALGGSRTEILRPENAVSSDDATISVTQLIYSSATEPYEIQYQMRQEKSGVWKMRNLIVESINLGVIYRNQFLASAKDYEGDLDKVIDNWTTPVEAEADPVEAETRL